MVSPFLLHSIDTVARQLALVSVAELRTMGGHDLGDLDIGNQAQVGHHVVERGLARLLVISLGPAERRGARLGLLLLPLGPETIDLGVVQEKYGVFG